MSIDFRHSRRQNRICQKCLKKCGYFTCLQCKCKLCESCSHKIHSQFINRNHTVIPLQSYPLKPLEKNQANEAVYYHQTNSLVKGGKQSICSAAIKTIREIKNQLDPAYQNTNLMELRKIENDKQIQKIMKREDDRMRRAEFLARQMSEKEHQAAITLQTNFYSFIHKRIAFKNARMERIISYQNKEITQPNDIAAIAIQRVFRTFSVQLYLQRNHLKLQSKEAICQNHQIELNSMWQDEHKNIAAQRVKKDFHNKRIFERLFGIRVLYGHKKKLVQIVEQESKTLIVRHQHCNELHTKYKNRMHTQDKDILDQNKTLSSYHSQSSHKIHSSTLKKLQTELKVLKAKKKNSEYLASLHLRAMHDIETQFRHLLRIRQKSMLLSQKSHDYLQLLEKEAETFRSILNFVSNKINSVELAKGSVYYMEWLNEQKQILTNYLICYDTDHELTISNETRRLCKELEYVSSAIKAFMQLWNTLLAQCSLIAEMIGPEIEQHRSDGKDENALIHIDRIHMLNIKQRMLRETIIPEIDYYLKTHYQNMEKDMRLAGVKCIGDKPTSNLENLSCSIYAVMCNDDNKLRQLFQMSDWMELFDSRPWIGNQIVAETRLDHRHEMERERLEQQLLALNEKKRTHTFDSEKALSIEKIMIDLQNESKQKGKSKFKQKEIIDAYETLKKTQNKFKQISLSREGAIISEEERIKYGFDNLMKQEDESKKRKEYLKRFNEEFESTETGVDEKSKADLNREKLWLKKEELSLQALVEKECDFEKTNTDYHQFKQSTENKSCNMSTLDTINNISQNELSKRYHSFKKRKEKYELNCCEVNRSLEKRRNLQKEARLQAVYALEQEQLKEIQKKIRQGRERLLAKSLLSIKYDNEIIEWPPNSEMLRINKLIESRYPDKDKADAVDLEDLVKRGTHLIQGIRQVTKRQNEDMEEKQMMITIRKRMALQQKKVVAISKLRFTVGKLETDKFAKENFDLQDRGLPFFRRVGKEIGVQDQLVIWALYTSDDKDFITSIKVSRAFVGRPLPIDLVEQGYDIIQHERMKGESVKDPSLCLWYKKDRKFSKAICDISVSYCSKDEEELLLEDFEKIEENLIKFGLSESYLWFRLIDRKALKKLGNPKHMADQYEEYCKMLANNPNDSILKDLVEKMRRRLRNVQLEEEKRFERKKGPVEDTADFLSMSSNDLEKFQKIYKKIDKDRDGYISLDEFRIFIGKPEEMSRYSNHIFILSIGHPPNDDRLDFGISLKAISMFCMFSKEETLKFIFSIYDKKGFGSIENDEFFQLLTMLHPNQRGRTTRALHEFDLPKSGRMNFDFFVSVHMRFPNMLFPAFDFQNQVRKKFLGVSFWEQKLQKFQEVKKKLRKELAEAESVANKNDSKISPEEIMRTHLLHDDFHNNSEKKKLSEENQGEHEFNLVGKLKEKFFHIARFNSYLNGKT